MSRVGNPCAYAHLSLINALRGGALLCGLGWGLLMPLLLAAQEPSTAQAPSSGSQSSSESGLTEGLLDLVEQPDPREAEPSSSEDDSSRELSPDDVGQGNESLGEQSQNPLDSVRQSMLIAASFLHRGSTGSDTQQLQQDIVRRLDELLEQLNKPSQSSSQTSQQSEIEQQQTSQEQQQTQSSSEDSTTTQQQPEEDGDAPSASDAGQQDQPGVRGESATADVQLKDPAALQQNVWGQLPERVRSQLQSRVVEQFLPSHQEQLEAYYEAMLEME